MKRPIEVLAGGFVLGELFVLGGKSVVTAAAAVLLVFAIGRIISMRKWKRGKLCASPASFCANFSTKSGRMRQVVRGLIFLLAMSFGVLRMSVALDLPEETLLDGETVTVQGIVEYCEEREDGMRLTLKHGQAVQGKRKEEGRWYLYGEGMKNLVPGNGILVEGTLSYPAEARNTGEFDYRAYCDAMEIRGQVMVKSVQILSEGTEPVGAFFQKLRRICYTCLYNAEREDRALLSAMILGNRSGIEDGEYDRFSESGTAHLLSISGLHLSIVGYSLFRVLAWLGVWIPLRCILPVGAVWAYACFAGGSASAIRAAVMFSMMMGGWLFGRTYDLRTGMSMAALYLFGVHPLYLTLTGVQYSFAALAGIAFLAPKLQKPFPRKWMSGWLLNTSIFLATLPVQCFYSYEFSPVSPLLNGLMIPWMSALLVLGIGGCAGSVICPPLGKVFFLPAHGILWLYRTMCLIPDKMPMGKILTGQPTVLGLMLYGIGLFLVLKKMEKRKWCIVLTAFLPLFLVKPPVTTLSIHFLDVGQGDCTVVQCPGGKTVMVDGGSTSNSTLYEYTLEPFLKANRIDRLEVVVATHMDQDHISALDELLKGAVQVDLLVLPSRSELEAKQETLKMLAKRNYEISIGEGFSLGNVRFTCISPIKEGIYIDENAYSVVLLLEYQGFRCLLTGDLGEDGEKFLLKEGLLSEVDVLKVGHHGSRYSSSEEFLRRVKPELAIISCQKNNNYGHPHQQTLLRLEEAKSKIWVTAESGEICVTSGFGKWLLKRKCG